MIKVNNVIKEMETLAPICLKEDFDNVGLMVGDRNKEVKKVTLWERFKNYLIENVDIIAPGIIMMNGGTYFPKLK